MSDEIKKLRVQVFSGGIGALPIMNQIVRSVQLQYDGENEWVINPGPSLDGGLLLVNLSAVDAVRIDSVDD